MKRTGRPRPNAEYDPLPLPSGCLSCPFERGNIYLGRPPWDLPEGIVSDWERILVTPSGWQALRPGVRDLFQDSLGSFLAQPGNLFRAAGDLTDLTHRRFTGFGGAARGVGIDASGHVVAAVKASGLSDAFSFANVTASNRAQLFAATESRLFSPRTAELVQPCGEQGPASIVDAEGVVYSSLRGELYMIGNDYSYVGADAYIYALATNRWQHIHLDGGSGVGNVLAATYVAAESKLYFIDNPFGLGVRLGRWDTRGSAVEWLGNISYGISDERAWLTQSLDGRLIFVTAPTNDSLPSHVSTLSPENGVVTIKTLSVPGNVFGTPLADEEGVSLDVATGRHVR